MNRNEQNRYLTTRIIIVVAVLVVLFAVWFAVADTYDTESRVMFAWTPSEVVSGKVLLVSRYALEIQVRGSDEWLLIDDQISPVIESEGEAKGMVTYTLSLKEGSPQSLSVRVWSIIDLSNGRTLVSPKSEVSDFHHYIQIESPGKARAIWFFGTR